MVARNLVVDVTFGLVLGRFASCIAGWRAFVLWVVWRLEMFENKRGLFVWSRQHGKDRAVQILAELVALHFRVLENVWRNCSSVECVAIALAASDSNEPCDC